MAKKIRVELLVDNVRFPKVPGAKAGAVARGSVIELDEEFGRALIFEKRAKEVDMKTALRVLHPESPLVKAGKSKGKSEGAAAG